MFPREAWPRERFRSWSAALLRHFPVNEHEHRHEQGTELWQPGSSSLSFSSMPSA